MGKKRKRESAPAEAIRFRWTWLGVGLILFSFLILAVVVFQRRRAAVSSDSARSIVNVVAAVLPPEVSTEGIDPAVVEAIRRDRDAVIDQPASAIRWGTLGMTLYTHEFAAEAATCFTQAEALDQQDPRWPYLHARSWLRMDPQAAVPLLERAAQLTGNTPGAVRLTLCELLLELHQLDAAERQLSAYLAERSEDPRARLAEARLTFIRGDHEASLRQLKNLAKYVQNQPAYRGRNRTLLLLMAEALRRTGQIEQASTVRRQAMTQSDPIWPDPYQKEAINRKVGLKPRLVKADLMFGRRQYEQSIEAFEGIIADYPESTWAKIYLARALIRTGAPDSKRPDAAHRLDRANEWLQEVLQVDTNSVEAMFRLGVSKSYQGKMDEAAEWYERAVATKPDFAMAHYNLSQCRMKLGEFDGAIQAAQAAIASEPNFVDAHGVLGMLLMRKDQYAEAEKEFDTAVRLQPNDPRLRKLLARARRQLRNASQ